MLEADWVPNDAGVGSDPTAARRPIDLCRWWPRRFRCHRIPIATYFASTSTRRVVTRGRFRCHVRAQTQSAHRYRRVQPTPDRGGVRRRRPKRSKGLKQLL